MSRPRNGGLPARRAVLRWGWRVYRREWRQQVLVIALLTFTVSGALLGVSVVYNTPGSLDARYGTADMLIRYGAADPQELNSQVASAQTQLGTVDVIGHRSATIPGLTRPVEVRAQDPHGPYGATMLRLVSGRYPAAAGEAAATDEVAALMRLRVGGQLTLADRTWSVVGVVENPHDLNAEFVLVSPAGADPPESVTILSHGTTVPNHRGSEEHRRGHRDPRRRRTDRRRDVRVRSGSPGDVPGLLGRRIRVHHDGSAPDATVRHARRDRGNGTARPSGHACRRRLGRHRRCGVRHGGRCRIVDSGDPSAGTGRGASHRSVQPALVADRRVPAAGRGHRHRGRLVARAGGCPHPDHPGPLPAPAAPTAGPPLGRPWPAPHGRRRGLPAVGFGQRGTRRGR